MFKNLNTFDFSKEVNRKQIGISFVKKGSLKHAYTEVRLYNTVVVSRQNVNNLTTLNSGGYRTMSTKRVMNRALQLIFGAHAVYISQRKGQWYVDFKDGRSEQYYDGMVIGGGSGTKLSVLINNSIGE